MKKLKRFAALLVASMMTLTSLQLSFAGNAYNDNMSAAEYKAWKKSLYANGDELTTLASNEISNDYLRVTVASDGYRNGRFLIWTTGGNPENPSDNNQMLLYSSSNTSFTSVKINDTEGIFEADTVETIGDSIIATQTIGNVEVRQIIRFENNPNTGRNDNLQISYEIVNNGSEPVDAGIRIMLDTMLGTNDGAPFRIPGYGNCTTEVEFEGDNIPQNWQAFDSLTSPNVISCGTFYVGGNDKPDKVQFAKWWDIDDTIWNYQITEGSSILGDSAVAMYYNPKTIPAGSSITHTTRYGMSDFNVSNNVPPVAIAISAPTVLNLTEDESEYIPNPVMVNANLENISNVTATNVTAEIILPNELELTQNSTAKINVGTLSPSAEKLLTWEFEVDPQTVEKTFEYNVILKADGMTDKVLNLKLTVPACKGKFVNPGKYVKFGRYNGMDILWRCIEKDSEKGALLLANNILDYRAFDDNSNEWSSSEIRKWLNNDTDGFLSSVNFNDTEKPYINMVENKAVLSNATSDALASGGAIYMSNKISDIGNFGNAAVRAVEDKMFLPSVKQMKSAYDLGDNYHLSMPVSEGDDLNNKFWLQTPYNNNNVLNEVDVIETNDVILSASAMDIKIGVRPAFYFKGTSKDFKSGLGTKTSPYCLYSVFTTSSDDPKDDGDYNKPSGGSGGRVATTSGDIITDEVYEDGVFIGYPTLNAYNVNNTEKAVRSVKDVIERINADDNISFDDVETLREFEIYAEDAIALSAMYSTEKNNIKIDKSTVERLEKISAKTKKDVEKLIEDNDIDLTRDLRSDITFRTSSGDKLTLNIDENIKELNVDNINFDFPAGSITLSKSLVENSNGEFSIAISNVRNEVILNEDINVNTVDNLLVAAPSVNNNGINVVIKNPSRESVVIALNRLPGDASYQAVVGTDGNTIVSKYNYPSQKIEGKTRDSGTYFVKNNEINFSDIANLSAAEQSAIKYLASKGVALGMGDGSYSPDMVLSRAQFTALLLKSIGEYDAKASGNGGFNDVPNGKWTAPVASSAKKCGIIKGFEDGTFKPDLNVSKEQVYQILGQAYVTSNVGIKITDGEVERYIGGFKDKGVIGLWARKNVALSRKRNIVTLSSDGNFNPKRGLTRAEAAVVMKKFFEDLPFKTNR